MSDLNLPSCHLKLCSLILSLVSWEKRTIPTGYSPLSGGCKEWVVCREPPLLQDKLSQLPELLPHMAHTNYPSQDILQHLSVLLVVREQHWAQHLRCVLTNTETQSLSSPAVHTASDTGQDTIDLSGYLGTAASCSVSCQSEPPGPFLPSRFPAALLQVCNAAGLVVVHKKHLALGLNWISCNWPWPINPAHRDPYAEPSCPSTDWHSHPI